MLSTEKLNKDNADNEAWYLLQVYSGQEENAIQRMEEGLGAAKLQHLISQLVIPKNETENINERRLFMGWVIVRMRMDKDAWNIIRTIPGVTGFVGLGSNPTPFHNKDWQQIPFARYTNQFH